MLALRSCPHQFSWPRRSPDGEYYQVCVLCGDEYEYDWNAMRRLGRRPIAVFTTQAKPPKSVTRWNRRARRIHLSGPVRYRQAGTDVWLDGTLSNIRHSGVLFVGNVLLAERTWVEIELDMPPEIVGGSAARRVKCAAEIIRTEHGERGTVFGAQIFDYDFVQEARS